MRRWSWLLCAFACVLSGCASAPMAPVGAHHKPVDVDEAGFWQAMAREEERLSVSAARLRDERLDDYLRELSCKLAPDLCADIRIYVLRSPFFNAFMAPNGMTVLFTGLLLRCENEAQLAFVLAHEIGHYRERHSLENWRRTKNTANVMAALGLLSGVGSAGGAAYLVGALGAFADLARFSRTQESEADQLAAASLRAAGYDLGPSVQLWQAALEEEKVNPKGALSAIFASHPATPERIAALQAAAAAASATERGVERWQSQLGPHRLTWLEDELARRNHAQTDVLLNRLQHGYSPPGAIAYARAEMYRQRSREGDLQRAVAAYRDALRHNDVPAVAARQLGLVLRRLGDTDASRRALRDYLRRQPDAGDRALIESYLQ